MCAERGGVLVVFVKGSLPWGVLFLTPSRGCHQCWLEAVWLDAVRLDVTRQSQDRSDILSSFHT
jgi:hypothetical protein